MELIRVTIETTVPDKKDMKAWEVVEYMTKLNQEMKSVKEKYSLEKDKDKKLNLLINLSTLQIKYVEFTK